jgi:hypothetical protein
MTLAFCALWTNPVADVLMSALHMTFRQLCLAVAEVCCTKCKEELNCIFFWVKDLTKCHLYYADKGIVKKSSTLSSSWYIGYGEGGKAT